MGKLTVTALRIIVALVLVGSLLVQVVMVPLLSIDLHEAGEEISAIRVPLLLIAVLGIAMVQLTLVCVWRLVSMVRRGTVFSAKAFRWVDIIFGAVSTAAVLAFVLGVILAPGDAVAPGIVLLVGGVGLLIACAGLVVLVLRMLLAQAVDRDAEAGKLQAELDEVV